MRVWMCARSILLLHSSFSAHTIHYFGWEQKKISDLCSEKCKLHSVAVLSLSLSGFFALPFTFHPAIHAELFTDHFLLLFHILFTNDCKGTRGAGVGWRKRRRMRAKEEISTYAKDI